MIALTVSEVAAALRTAALAYHSVQPARPPSTLVLIDDVSGVQGSIRKLGGRMEVTFRGTDSLKDVKADLTVWKKCIPYGNTASDIRVHSGFLNAYKSPGVRDLIQRHVTPEIDTLYITGHSYGAALAVLCAVDLEYNFPDREFVVVLFGCPRVGNRAFSKSYNRRIFNTLRVENGNDLVTKMPFASWGYRHVGIKTHIGMPRLPGLFSFEQHHAEQYYRHFFREYKPQ